MKTPDEFKRDIYSRRDSRLKQRRRVRKRVLLACVPVLTIVVLCAVSLPPLMTGGTGSAALPAAGNAAEPLCVQAAKPGMLKELSTIAGYLELEGLSPEEQDGAAEEVYQEMDQIQEERKKNYLDRAFPEAVNAFARDSTSLLAGDFEENACFSPLSLYYALALAGSGANGETEQEFLDVLGAPDEAWISDQCAKFYRLRYRDNVFSKFQLANSLWLDGRSAFEEPFLATASEQFYSSLFQADFTNPGLGGEVTKWVSENTNGLLSPEFSFTGEERLAILNTVYLKDQWVDQFSEEGNTADTFTKADGNEVTATFMHRGYTGRAYRGNGFSRASLPLRETGEMIFILPDEGVSPQDLLADPEKFEDMFYPKDWDEMKSYVLEWSVPKFSFDSEYDLSGLLPALGLSTAFDLTKADFSGISAGPDPLFLSSARQGVHIGIDENGVEAAAYTALIEAGAAEPPTETLEMDLDRPFLFAILSSDPLAPEAGEEYASSGTLLFVGVCGDPTAK